LSSNSIQIPLRQVPESLIALISDVLHSYSTTLIKIPRGKDRPERPFQIGSGTFVSLENTFGILTAQHVARELDGNCSLGLAIIQDEHVCQIENNYLKIVDVASAPIPADGPDLAFIVLPGPAVSTIKASKFFFDLTADKQLLLHNPPSLDSGIWFVCGTPAEKTQFEESDKGFREAIAFKGFAFATGATKEYVRDDYDFIEVGADYNPNSDIPQSYSGMSGGGLWQVLIRQSAVGMLEPTRYFLSGVVFYQSEVMN
jgi:hypothetical protein